MVGESVPRIRAATATVSLALVVCLATSAPAQLTDAAAGPSVATPTAATNLDASASRDTEYAALARDVGALGRELGLIKRVVKLVTPAVVHIEATPLPRYQGLLNVEEAGSGVIVQFGTQFFVLTNRHVIRHSTPERIKIHLADGRTLVPDRIWSDPDTDVAVMAVNAPNLVPVRLGDSDALEIGDYVLAVGSPFGLSQSVTRGIVSARGRHNLDLGDAELQYQDFIQTDAAINPGNSGGPLVNLRGEVVGLNTAIASASGGNEGIGFSIPVNIVSRIARALVETSAVPRGYLGVNLDFRFNEERAHALGLSQLVGTRVSNVEPGSPADHAGLRVNDVILKYNGVRIEQDAHLVGLVKLTEIGRTAELVVFRDGKPMQFTVQIGNERDFTKSPE
jgi:serine protease Do